MTAVLADTRCEVALLPGERFGVSFQRAGTAPVVLRSMGEVAMALHLSGPRFPRNAPVERLAALIVETALRLGIDTIRDKDTIVRLQMLYAMRGGSLNPFDPVWSEQRETRCSELAHQVVYGWEVSA